MMFFGCGGCQGCDKGAGVVLSETARIALVGNPNCGKTSLYNELTGDYERVGNFPGITVSLKTGKWELGGVPHTLVDLPGVYSLEAFARDEQVTLDFLTQCRPDLIVNVIDASNLERHLYLTAQISELGIPVVVVLNMMDVAERMGVTVDVSAMSALLGVPVIPVVAPQGKGLCALRDACTRTLSMENPPCIRLYDMTHELEADFEALEMKLAEIYDFLPFPSVRWCAVRLTEEDHAMTELFRSLPSSYGEGVQSALTVLLAHLRVHSAETGDVAVAEARHAFASGLFHQCVKVRSLGTVSLTERIDRWVCHRYLGIGLMVLTVYLLFAAVFAFADDFSWIPWGWTGEWLSPSGCIERGFSELTLYVDAVVTNPILNSMLTMGVIAGVGGVLVFVPMLLMMFIFIAVLEDSGYIARVSFILDRVLRIFGLQGKAVLSLVMAGGLGPGCAVPAVMATRTLRDEKDRLVTMLVSPMMNCGAKMPVLTLLVAGFFAESRQLMMLLLWLLSWVCALLASFVLSKWVVRGETTPFVMELPVYHLPRLRGVLAHAWHNTWLYIQKAGTVILVINLLIWALMYFPSSQTENTDSVNNSSAVSALEHSYAGRLGNMLTPISSLCGFDWRENIALIGGAGAKEVVLTTLSTAYAMSEPEDIDSFKNHLQTQPDWNPLRAFVLMLFVMLYSPCVATLAAIYKETRSWKWVLFATGYSTVFAYVLCVIVYQTGLWIQAL